MQIKEIIKKYNSAKFFFEKFLDKDKLNKNKTGIELQAEEREKLEKLMQKASKMLRVGEEVEVIKGKVYIKKLHDKLHLSFQKIKEHILITGKTRVGKSVLMKRFIRQFLEYREKYPEQKMEKRLLNVDVKGDVIQQFWNEKEFILINPFDQRGYGIEVFSLIEFDTDISSVSSALVPETPGTEAVFIQGPRQIVEGGIRNCIRKGTTTNKDLSDFLKLSAQEMLIDISYPVVNEEGKKVRKAHKGCEVLFSQLSSSQGAIFLSSAVTYFEAIYALADSKRNIVLQDYIKNDPRNIIVANFSRISAKMTPIISLFVNQLATFMMEGKPNPNNNFLFILDEFSSLSKIKAVEDVLQKGAEFGVSLMILLQEYGRVKQIYGESFQTFFNNTGTKFFFSIIDVETRETIQKYFGSQTIKERTENQSSGDTDSRDGFSNNYQVSTKNVLSDNSVLQGLNKQEFFYSESEVSDKKDGNSIIYVGRITGFFDPSKDIYPAKNPHFIHNKEIEVDYFTKKLLEKIEQEKPEIDNEELDIKNEEAFHETLSEIKEHKTINSIKDKFNKIKENKTVKIEKEDLSDDDLNKEDDDYSPFV